MNFLKKIGRTLDIMMWKNPFITTVALLILGVALGSCVVFLVVEAPLMAITVAGVAVAWIIVLFVNKFIEEMKR